MGPHISRPSRALAQARTVPCSHTECMSTGATCPSHKAGKAGISKHLKHTLQAESTNRTTMPGWVPLLTAATASVAGSAVLRYALRPRAIKSATIQPHQSLRCTDAQISILSLNILAPGFTSSRKYGHCPPAYLNWEYRWSKLKALLAQLDADVVCLQEVEVARCARAARHTCGTCL